MRSMVEGGERSEHGDVGPLHRSSSGPPPRAGEDHFAASFASLSSRRFVMAAA